MRIYIIEDDVTVIGILEDIVERSVLGTVCGATDDGPPDLERILALAPDLILADLLMPGKDGIQVIRELREMGCAAKFIMISQVSSKELIAKAYTAGVEFFIQKPINLIEVRQVIQNVTRQLENERALQAIQSVFVNRAAPAPAPKEDPWDRERRRIKYILSQLGMAGEKGSRDITDLCLLLLERGQTASQVGEHPVRPAQRRPQDPGAAGPPGGGAGAEPHRQPGAGGLQQRIFRPLLRPTLLFPGGAG